MKHLKIVLFLLFAATISAYSQADTNSLLKFIDKTKISGNWFISYNYNDLENTNQFTFKRGYLTFRNELSDIFSLRFTQDITLDEEGSDAGNVEMRLKYLFMKLKLKDIDLLKHSYIEFGLVPRPWIDFEQKINRYRVQGKMYAEEYGIINSADFGVSYSGLIGGEIDKEFQQKISSNYPGRYGSFSIGIFNGGGYSAIENNNNKTIEGRLSIRPLPDIIPGMQFGYSFALGKSNTETAQEFNMHIAYLIYQCELFTLLTQYYTGKGGYQDDLVNPNSQELSLDNDGYSIFGEFKIPNTKLALFGRYDNFVSHFPEGSQDDLKVDSKIAGISYNFLAKNKILFDYESTNEYGTTIPVYEIAVEISF